MNKLAKFTYYAVRVVMILAAIYIFIIEPIAVCYMKGVKAMLTYYFVIAVVIGLYELYNWANRRMDEMEDNDGSTA